MSEGITGHGVEFQRNDGSDFATIANVFNVTGPGMSRDSVEITTASSPGGWREKIGGLRDGGQATFTINYTREGYLILKEDFENDETVQYQIALPDEDETEITFNGLVTELPLAIPEGDRITSDVTIEISGEVETDAT